MAVGWPRGEDGPSRRCCILSSGVGFFFLGGGAGVRFQRIYSCRVHCLSLFLWPGLGWLRAVGGKAHAPAASKAHLPRAEGIRHLLPAAPPALVRPEAPQSSPGARAPWGRLRASRGRDSGESPGPGPRAAARPASPLGCGAPRRGGARRAAAPSARPDRGGASKQARSWASAGLCARLSGYTLPAPRAPRAGWPRTSADSSGVRRAGSGARSPPGGSLSLGSLDCCSSSPGSQRGELEANPAGRRAPINSTRVLAWRPPGCARTKLCAGTRGARQRLERTPPPSRLAPWNRSRDSVLSVPKTRPAAAYLPTSGRR